MWSVDMAFLNAAVGNAAEAAAWRAGATGASGSEQCSQTRL